MARRAQRRHPPARVEDAEYVAFARRIIRALGRRASSDIDTLPGLAALRVAVDQELHFAVAECRADGRSWAEIGARLGITKQTAQERFSRQVCPDGESLSAGTLASVTRHPRSA